jgi:hypothetical protein
VHPTMIERIGGFPYRIRRGVSQFSERTCASAIQRCLRRYEPSSNASPLEIYLLDVRRAVRVGSAFSAISLALALPDICGSVEFPEEDRVWRRYVDWCDAWARGLLSLESQDCYALRCAYLHNGTGSFSGSSAEYSKIFNEVHFTSGKSGGVWVHRAVPSPRGGLKATMRAQVPYDDFCHSMTGAAMGWWMKRKDDERVSKAVNDLMRLSPPA